MKIATQIRFLFFFKENNFSDVDRMQKQHHIKITVPKNAWGRIRIQPATSYSLTIHIADAVMRVISDVPVNMSLNMFRKLS